MIEEEHIDDLFRSNLLHQEILIDPHALENAMHLLDDREKKNTRLIYWISGLLGLLAIGVGLAFFFCRSEDPMIGNKIESPSLPVSAPKSERTDALPGAKNLTTDTKKYNSEDLIQAPNGIKNSEEIVVPSSDQSGFGSQHAESSERQLNSTILSEEPSTSLHGDLNGSATMESNPVTSSPIPNQVDLQSTAQETNIKPGEMSGAGISTRSLTDSANDAPPNFDATNSSTRPDINSKDLPAEDVNVEVLQTHDVESMISQDSILISENYPDSLKEMSDIVKPGFNAPTFSKWDIRLAGSAFTTFTKIHGRNSFSEAYVMQRNEQESALPGFGLELSMCRNNKRSFMNVGLGYAQTRENIRYSASKTEQQITSEFFVEYESVVYMIVDGTGTNQNAILWDTTYMTIDVDSTLFEIFDTTTTTSENTAISAFNGATRWSHLYLPVTFGLRLDHKTKSSLYAVVSLEFDYLASSNAHYLTADGQSVKGISDYPGYRRFMVNGTVGIEWRKLLGGDRMYLMVNPGIRTNLYSWNTDFKHNTLSPFVRMGIGWRFQEK